MQSCRPSVAPSKMGVSAVSASGTGNGEPKPAAAASVEFGERPPSRMQFPRECRSSPSDSLHRVRCLGSDAFGVAPIFEAPEGPN
jgi:hypothetical protein